MKPVSPLSLLRSTRLDIVAKFLFARDYLQFGVSSKWTTDIYLEHIRAFNNFVEGDGSKIGSDEFLAAFLKLLNSMSESGYDDSIPVPVNTEGIILDGAHRVGTCLALNLPVTVNIIERTAPVYDYNFFLARGFSRNYCDELVSEYCKLKPNTRAVLLFPSAVDHDSEVDCILKKYGIIVYKKHINLNALGALNLIRQVYQEEAWVGDWSDGFKGAKEKAAMCFSRQAPLRVYFLESEYTDRLVNAKLEIRGIFGIGKHSIHINDTHQETILLSQLLLNENSIHHLNTSKIKFYKWFYYLLKEYKDLLLENDNMEDNCIVGGSVLATYGLRPSNDLDFISLGSMHSTLAGVDVDNAKWEAQGFNVYEIVSNPVNHFYYYGIKFCTLKILALYKKKRSESRDIDDLLMISQVTGNKVEAIPKLIHIATKDFLAYKVKSWLKQALPPRVLRILLILKKRMQHYP